LEVNRGIAMERAQQRQAEKQEQIKERAHRLSAREAKALEKQLRKEYEQTQKLSNKRESENKFAESVLTNALNEIAKEDEAATLLSSVYKGHQARQNYDYIKNIYPKQKAFRKSYVENVEPLTNLQKRPPKTYYEKALESKKNILLEKTKDLPVYFDLMTKKRQEEEKVQDIFIENASERDINEEIKRIERLSDLSEADTLFLEKLRKIRSDKGKKRGEYMTKGKKLIKERAGTTINKYARAKLQETEYLKNLEGMKTVRLLLEGERRDLQKKIKQDKKDKAKVKLYKAELKEINDRIRENEASFGLSSSLLSPASSGEVEGHGIRGRYIPKKRNVAVSKTNLLKNRLNLITSEIKAGNDNPKLIVELNKLYKKLYDVDNVYMYFKRT
jgi:hypothetical protein